MRSINFRLAISSFMLLTLCVLCYAEVSSGFWTLVEPSSDRNASFFDFSDLTPFCGSEGIPYGCSSTAFTGDDGHFNYDSIIVPNGVFFDSSISVDLQSKLINGKSINRDREGLFYLDSMMKRFQQQAPQAVYRGSCPARKGVYFLKTNENWYAVLLKIGEYIGGIDRTYYYWAYQPDTGAVLFKNNLYDLPMSLSITVDVFSGRPNPSFTLSDSAGIAEITRQIYLSVNTLLDSSNKRTDTARCNPRLGYRSLSVTGMFEPENSLSSYIPSIQICNGLITYYKVSPASSIMPPQFLYDKDSRLEKLIIRVCCKNNLVSTDQYGPVPFCDVIPDSLKDPVSTLQGKTRSGSHNAFIMLKAVHKGIRYRVTEAGRIRIELFDVRGKYVSMIADRHHDRGEYYIDLHGKPYTPGIYLVKCTHPGITAREVVSPLILR